MDPAPDYSGRPAASTPAPRGASPGALWPDRIRELAHAWREESSPRARESAQAELWTLVNLVLKRYAASQASRMGRIPLEDIRDIAADKTLALLRRLRDASWDPWSDTPAEVCSFLATVARNGVADFLRERGREVPYAEPWGAADASGGAPAETISEQDRGDRAVPGEGAECAKAILDCLSQVTAKSRLVWFLRAFYDLSSAQTARHPAVASKPAAVDTMVRRVRMRLRECLRAKGHDPERFPTGTFTALWEAFFGSRGTAPYGLGAAAPGQGGIER